VARPILVVDDDDAILELVQMTLENEGYSVITASDGAEALELLEKHSPSLILLDMRMPRVNGWQFAEAYRKRPAPHSPIVVITAATDVAQRAADIGAEGFLGKPFDLRDLLAAVERHVS
jgi:CheY-like chemotaxis protein